MPLRRAALWLAVLLLIPGSASVAQARPGRPFTILVSNDDGYRAPGIEALVDSLRTIARVIVAAPEEQQSGTGHGITYREPIYVRQVDDVRAAGWYAIAARPATCVRLALTSLVDAPPDLVVSGINAGDNLGVSAWISGTVGAAREGALQGVPGIAISMNPGGPADYAYAAGFLRTLIERLRTDDLLRDSLLLNVNVPSGGAAAVRGVRVARMSPALGQQRYERRVSPRGRVYYWDAWEPPESDGIADSDLTLFRQGYITIVPLVADQTAATVLGALGPRLDQSR
jgi:5'-nucleotidase